MQAQQADDQTEGKQRQVASHRSTLPHVASFTFANRDHDQHLDTPHQLHTTQDQSKSEARRSTRKAPLLRPKCPLQNRLHTFIHTHQRRRGRQLRARVAPLPAHKQSTAKRARKSTSSPSHHLRVSLPTCFLHFPRSVPPRYAPPRPCTSTTR